MEKISIVIRQDSDCCSSSDLGNLLEITTCDGGGGSYLVISGRWAMENNADIDGLATLLKDVLRYADDPADHRTVTRPPDSEPTPPAA